MAHSSDSPAPVIELHGRKLLLVDDERLNIRILENILKSEGYTLRCAESGEQALEIYAEFEPDLVLLDVVLPGIDGFATCEQIRRRFGAAAAPVIFITALSESDDIVRGFNVGGVDYLSKPYRPREVLARIRTHLQNRLLLSQITRANIAKNRFLGMAAHDLRNPLASIRGLAEFLQDPMLGTLTPDQLDLAQTIQSTSHNMLALVNELLDVAVIEAGQLQLKPAPTSLADLVASCIQLAQLDASRKGTTIEFLDRPVDGVPLVVDAAKIRQVIDNLISNAVKYSPPQSVVGVAISTNATLVTLVVTDQGPGIPAGEHDRLFKDFGRLSVQPTGGEKSTGLGLAICRKIVEAHHGTITAENLPTRGCAFTVSLPHDYTAHSPASS